MSTQIMVTIVIGLVAAAGGVAVGVQLTATEPETLETDLEDRVRALESRLESVRVTERPAPGGPRRTRRTAEIVALQREITALKARLDQAPRTTLDGERDVAPADEPVAAVTELIDQRIAVAQKRRDREAADRRRDREDKKARRDARGHAEKVARAMDLHPDQKERLFESLAAVMTANAPLWGAVRNEDIPHEKRLGMVTSIKENLTAFHAELGGLFAPSQIEQYHGVGNRQTDPRTFEWLIGFHEELTVQGATDR